MSAITALLAVAVSARTPLGRKSCGGFDSPVVDAPVVVVVVVFVLVVLVGWGGVLGGETQGTK